MADTPKTTPILLGIIALAIGYAGWSGDGLNLVGELDLDRSRFKPPREASPQAQLF